METENQVRCPNCGGYRVADHIDRIETDSRKIVAPPSEPFGFLDFMAVLSILMIIGGIAFGILNPGFLIVTVIGILFLIIIWVFKRLIRSATGRDPDDEFKKKHAQFIAMTIEQHTYNCVLCGYHWSWAEGDARPDVTIRSDLIQKGEQRLREEERARRRQQGL